jgi:aminodeoxyfutalosine synthase
MTTGIDALLRTADQELRRIGEKIIARERITPAEGITLFEKGSLPFLGALANYVRERLHGHKTYFNRNFHIEPTNVCVFTCNFCSYSRVYAHRDEGWELSQQSRRTGPTCISRDLPPLSSTICSAKQSSRWRRA